MTALVLKRTATGSRSGLAAQALSIVGLAAQAVVFGLLVNAMRHQTAELTLPFGFSLVREGVLSAALWLAGCLLLLLLPMGWPWMRGRTVSRFGLWVLACCTLSIALGPAFQLRTSGPERVWTKRGLQDVLEQPWGRQAGLWLRKAAGQDAGPVSCIAWTSTHHLLLNVVTKLRPWHSPASYGDGALADAARCQSESDAALAHGVAIESHLLQGDVPRYLSLLPRERMHDPIGLPLTRCHRGRRRRMALPLPRSRSMWWPGTFLLRTSCCRSIGRPCSSSGTHI